VLANIVGTTGASVLLIRPFMRMNHGRLRAIHVVLFIFIVSNCGGSMTPIGDPPLYLGFIKGVPFFWTLENMWYDWVFTIGSLIAVFWFIDSRIPAAPQTADAADTARFSLRMRGTVGIAGLVLIIAGVFVDPFLAQNFGVKDIPVGATLQALVGLGAFLLGSKDNRAANAFNLEPIKEVALLFVGIFATMTPALGYLATHGNSLGISSPTSFYFATGALSAFLDNAPTYLNFLQIAVGDQEITPTVVRQLLATTDGRLTVNAISTAAVFFGAMTYIGNGPNFMVKAIAEQAGVKMPSFFGYFGLAICILLPILIVHWAIFIR
jgi:Na+/H+ antiporter NhaD/arsenite permease-like protein